MSRKKYLPIRVVLLPSMLREEDVVGRAVVVFDVLRATTSMAAALAAGVESIRVYGTLNEAHRGAMTHEGPRLLAGEQNCVAPEGFDLGNSPGAFVPDCCVGRSMFMSTTNGTKALVAARKAKRLYTGALVNARATARMLIQAQLPITLLCAGTEGCVAMEDFIGCGAVLGEIEDSTYENDEARMAHLQWKSLPMSLDMYLWVSRGGTNILRADLEPDIQFAAQLNAFDIGVKVEDRDGQLIATAERPPHDGA